VQRTPKHTHKHTGCHGALCTHGWQEDAVAARHRPRWHRNTGAPPARPTSNLTPVSCLAARRDMHAHTPDLLLLASARAHTHTHTRTHTHAHMHTHARCRTWSRSSWSVRAPAGGSWGAGPLRRACGPGRRSEWGARGRGSRPLVARAALSCAPRRAVIITANKHDTALSCVPRRAVTAAKTHLRRTPAVTHAHARL
jgi:hypothetical protein